MGERMRQVAIIVDDDEATRKSLRFLLECEGIVVEDYADATQLIAAPSWPPRAGCMVLDLHMPGMTGIEVLEALRRGGSKVPVVIVTGHPNGANRRRAMASGALEFLEKPLNDGRIVELVRAALENGPSPG